MAKDYTSIKASIKASRLLELIDNHLWEHAVKYTDSPSELRWDDAHSYHITLQSEFADHITKQFLESRESTECGESDDLGYDRFLRAIHR